MFTPKNLSWLSSDSMSVWYSSWEHKDRSSLMIRWLHNPLRILTAIKKPLLLGVAHPWDEWNKPNSSTLFTLSFFFFGCNSRPCQESVQGQLLVLTSLFDIVTGHISYYHVTLSWPGYAWQRLRLSHPYNR